MPRLGLWWNWRKQHRLFGIFLLGNIPYPCKKAQLRPTKMVRSSLTCQRNPQNQTLWVTRLFGFCETIFYSLYHIIPFKFQKHPKKPTKTGSPPTACCLAACFHENAWRFGRFLLRLLRAFQVAEPWEAHDAGLSAQDEQPEALRAGEIGGENAWENWTNPWKKDERTGKHGQEIVGSNLLKQTSF